MLTGYDYVVIGFFLLFMLSLGPVFKHFSKNDSDFFRGGGQMLWWMVGGSAFMTQFSAWTFTGAASKAYADGSLVATIFIANGLACLVGFLWFAPRFRQMRVVTPIESVRERFGAVNEQLFTWIQVPLSLVYAAIWLNGLAIFASAVFELDLTLTIWVVGIVVIVLSVSGGSWAIAAGDFMQLLILMAISIVTAVFVLGHADIGGISGLLDKVPVTHFDWNKIARPEIIWLWVGATFVKQMIVLNNMQDSYRYLGVKDGRDARKGALLAGILMMIGPLIWFIPPMAARVLESDLSKYFPMLKNPAEASYIFAAQQVLPLGMMGLLVCGLFAATISSMDSGLNRNAGIFVRSFYQRIVKDQTPTQLLMAGRVMSAAFGVAIIIIATLINKLEGLDLFSIMMMFSGLIALPYIIPLFLGVVIKKTPSWSGWSTMLVGFTVSLVINVCVDPQAFAQVCGFEPGMSKREIMDFLYGASILTNLVVSVSWFMVTSLFYKQTTEEFRERVDKFYEAMATPVDFEKEVGASVDGAQSRVMAILCFVYGGFVGMLTFIPNPLSGRLAFLFCSALICGVGAMLYRSSCNKLADVLDELVAQEDA